MPGTGTTGRTDPTEPDWYRAEAGSVVPATREAFSADEWAAGGTYSLVLDLPAETPLEVGALGTHTFPAGAYVYTGSALGTGGFSRVDRHAAQCRGDRSVTHWHVDALTTHPETSLSAVVLAPGNDVECPVATPAATDVPVDGFGASDCDCRTHLGRSPTVADALSSLSRRYASVTAP